MDTISVLQIVAVPGTTVEKILIGSCANFRVPFLTCILHITDEQGMKRTMILGAGQAGTMVASQLLNNPGSGMKPVLYLDDDRAKKNLNCMASKFLATRNSLKKT